MNTEAMSFKPSLAQRIRRYVFPYRNTRDDRIAFQSNSNGSYKPGTTVVTNIRFSLRDRLRLLLGGTLELEVVVNCEVDPIRTEARTFLQIL
jgi:hypothetical protein